MFSKGMVGLSFLNLIFARADIFVLGKLYSPAMLGIYALAVNLIQTPAKFPDQHAESNTFTRALPCSGRARACQPHSH